MERLLREMRDRKASDLYLKPGNYPYLRVEGKIVPIGEKRISPEEMEEVISFFLPEEKREKFWKEKEIDISFQSEELGRFRVNLFQEKNRPVAVVREVKEVIPSFEELNLPGEVLRTLCREKNGLVLVTGPAGCGKSTTLAAMIEYINSTLECHILTIEDPIEFVHQDRKSIVNQREVGSDTLSFSRALKSVVRESPDVIMIGEIRDRETLQAAIDAAETGQLVLTSLHTIDAPQTIERILSLFPLDYQNQIRLQLSNLIKGIISLRLLPRKDGKGRVPAVSVMLGTPTIRKYIREGRIEDIYRIMEEGKIFGMCTFNQALLELYSRGIIEYEVALAASDRPHEFEIVARGIIPGSKGE